MSVPTAREAGLALACLSEVLFIAAGERILAYQLAPPQKLWQDLAEAGFLDWEQHGDAVLLSAELQFAAWDTAGRKLWTMFVEPPWQYFVKGDVIELDVMGNKQSFRLREGPPQQHR